MPAGGGPAPPPPPGGGGGRPAQAGLGLGDGAGGALDYLLNLVRPVVFPFLQDCAEVAHLRLTERIDMSVRRSDQRLADLSVRWDQIVPANGEDLLSARAARYASPMATLQRPDS